jgi:deoxyribonuclease (pyrimidine dimer)
MTRINAGYPVHNLTRQHLLAEHREIKRIPNAIRTGKAIIKDIPATFTLGKGHVRFFYNKLGYLLTRYQAIHAECKHRGYNVIDYSNAWQGIPNHLLGHYTPTKEAIALITERINIRLKPPRENYL